MSSKDTGAMGEENGEKSALVPRLRFPEFRAADGWKEKPLGSICDVLNNKRQPISSDQRKSGPFPYYGASGIVDFVDNYLFDERLVLIGEDGAKWGAFEKTAFIAEGKYWVNNHAHVLRPVEVNDVLLENYLVMLDLGPYVAGAAPPKLTLAKLKWIPVRFPAAQSEQQKIADCLTSLDELITAETHALAALKTHKKGLMQQLFPREGETVPHLRFPEFREAGEWGVRALLHYIASLDAGVSVNSGDRPTRDDEIGVLKTSCVSDGNFDVAENKVVQEPEEIERVKEPVCANTIIISRMNTIALVGANAFVENDIPNLFLPDRLWAAKSTGRGNMRFLAYVLGSEGGRAALSGLASGSSGTMKNIGKSEVLALQVTAPTIAEQQRIAECLSSIDDLITAQSQKIDALKTHKKGLIQQLFPVPDEAPG